MNKKEYLKMYREKNREKINEYHKNWAKNNRKKIIKYQTRYWSKKNQEVEDENIRNK